MALKSKSKSKDMFNPVFAVYFDQGINPTIDCVNLTQKAPTPNFPQMIAALSKFVDVFGKVWGVSATLSIQPAVRPGNWGLVFVDNATVKNALGYHDLSKDGLPMSYVFTDVTKKAGEPITVTASHELCECLIDPGVQMHAMDLRNGRIYAYEVADAVERETFDIDGFPMTNFQYPAWFEGFRKPGSTKFDYLGTCRRPFQINRGGYMSIYKPGVGWSEIFGSRKAEQEFSISDHKRASLREGITKSKKSKV